MTDDEFLKLDKHHASEALYALREDERSRLTALYAEAHGERIAVKAPGADLAVAKLIVSVGLLLAVAGCTYLWFGS